MLILLVPDLPLRDPALVTSSCPLEEGRVRLDPGRECCGVGRHVVLIVRLAQVRPRSPTTAIRRRRRGARSLLLSGCRRRCRELTSHRCLESFRSCSREGCCGKSGREPPPPPRSPSRGASRIRHTSGPGGHRTGSSTGGAEPETAANAGTASMPAARTTRPSRTLGRPSADEPHVRLVGIGQAQLDPISAIRRRPLQPPERHRVYA